MDGEQVAFWNSRQPFEGQMAEHLIKYMNWHIDGDAWEEGIER